MNIVTRRSQDPNVGDAVTLQPHDTSSSLRVTGRLVSISRFLFSVEFTDPHPWKKDDELILAFGPTTYRFAALIKLKEDTPAGTKFFRQSPWRPLNTRSFPRFHIEAPVTVSYGEVELPGWTSNVSFGGLAVRLEELPEQVDVSIRLGKMAPVRARFIAGAPEAARFQFLDISEDQLWDVESFILARTPHAEEPAA